MTLWKWSQTAATNASADSTINWAEGQAPASVNDSARAMMAAVSKYRDDTNGSLVTAGTSTAYTITTNQVFDTLAHLAGARISFAVNANCGATVTLAVDGLAAKPLRRFPSIELTAGQLVNGTVYTVTYNNSDAVFYLQNQTGPRPVTYQIFTSGSAATYTTPASVAYIRVRAVGGGGGGGGSSGGGTGGTGGDTIFNSIHAAGGVGGGPSLAVPVPGAGGSSGTGTATLRISGSTGGNGSGGNAPLFCGAGGTVGGVSTNGATATANSGGGGGGATSAGGGGSGEYIELVIAAPAASYTYTIGAAGTAGTTGGTATGGTGAAGRIIVEEYYL